MSELPRTAAAFLEAARKDHSPSAADRERVHAALLDALLLSGPHDRSGAMDPQAPSPSGPGPGPTAMAATASVAPKLALLAALALGGIGAWSWSSAPARTTTPPHAPGAAASYSAAPAEAPQGARTQAALDASSASNSGSVAPALTKEDSKVADVSRSERARKRHVPSPAHAAKAGVLLPASFVPQQVSAEPVAPVATSTPALANTPGAAPVEASRPSTLAELVLIRRALSALRAGSPAGALRALAEHRANHPAGALLSEREGLYVVALCEEGQLETGRRHKAAFLQRFATSPIATRVRAACQGDAR